MGGGGATGHVEKLSARSRASSACASISSRLALTTLQKERMGSTANGCSICRRMGQGVRAGGLWLIDTWRVCRHSMSPIALPSRTCTGQYNDRQQERVSERVTYLDAHILDPQEQEADDASDRDRQPLALVPQGPGQE